MINKFRLSFFERFDLEVLNLQWTRLTLCLEKKCLLNSFIIFSTNCIYFRTIFSAKKEKGQLISCSLFSILLLSFLSSISTR